MSISIIRSDKPATGRGDLLQDSAHPEATTGQRVATIHAFFSGVYGYVVRVSVQLTGLGVWEWGLGSIICAVELPFWCVDVLAG